jgi:hypothetical protein
MLCFAKFFDVLGEASRWSALPELVRDASPAALMSSLAKSAGYAKERVMRLQVLVA